jgi:hypothetical protein
MARSAGSGPFFKTKHVCSPFDDIDDAQRFGPREGTDVANRIQEEAMFVVALEKVEPRDL